MKQFVDLIKRFASAREMYIPVRICSGGMVELPEISRIELNLTLEGLRLVWGGGPRNE